MASDSVVPGADGPGLRLARLASLLPGASLHGDGEVRALGVTLDSRRVTPGDLYAAIPGSHAHGAAFWPEARDAGAVAVLTDSEGAAVIGADTAMLEVPGDVRGVLGQVSALVYGEPAQALRTIGVTGTQGKTTTTRLLESGLWRTGVPAAVIGTVGTRILGDDVSSALTTPEAPDLHRLLRRMVDEGVEACAMEVSSHALVLGRVDAVVFDVAVFLNLGRDHLDFHPTMEDYFDAKASLFTPERAVRGLVNVQDEWGRRLVETSTIPVQTMAADGSPADWSVADVEVSASGSRFRIVSPEGDRIRAGCPIPGAFNVANALAAVAAAATAGYDPAEVAEAIASGPGVPGRLERIEEGQDFVVVVDYAHKPDALAAVLATLRPVTEGRIVVVLGAGGDRDPGKRPVMGEIAARDADLLVVTDDNPRSEEPAAIRAAILAGASGGSAEVVEIGDRRAAISEAFARARAGDVVLVAGKGHESGQEVAGVVHPFDDRVVSREELTR
ncbi:MAG: UDP-N-acetylmuramoyl-L-alanyl-D-glutamate--2,6-diaminopimelate ligase [Nocardioides sp.]